jgi:hypothetical protein
MPVYRAIAMESDMTAELLKNSGWTIAAAALFLLSLLSPLMAAPLLLIWSGVAGLFGYFRKEWGGLPPVIITIVSSIFLVIVFNRLFFAQ